EAGASGPVRYGRSRCVHRGRERAGHPGPESCIMTGRRRSFGTVRRRNGKWQAYYTKNGKKVSLGMFNSRGAASAALADVESQRQRGTWIDPRLGRITLQDYAEEWMLHRHNLRERTRDTYASLL